jgi:aryl-alcohol dehydrogenase-like predicted oxidoreductase
MQYCQLGKTEITVSTLAMGCWALAGDPVWGPQDEADSIGAVHSALDVGVNFFDTAEGYTGGQTEVVLGKALSGVRYDAVIATKASGANLSGDQLQKACEDSLRRLGTDYIDLYQIHWPNRDLPLEETVTALERLQKQGKVRAVGVCNFGSRDLVEILEAGQIESNQLPYSLLWRAIEFEIQAACEDNDVGILCYSPLAQGLLTGKFSTPEQVPEGRARVRLFSSDRPLARHGDSGCEPEVFTAIDQIREICASIGHEMTLVSLAWLWHQPGVAVVIAGARKPDQIRQSAQAVGLALAPEILAQLADATEKVKDCIGPNPDLWQSASRFR